VTLAPDGAVEHLDRAPLDRDAIAALMRSARLPWGTTSSATAPAR
jgi:hypothetical protein